MKISSLNVGEKFIQDSVGNGLKHVFLISNPINAILVRLIIDRYKIQPENTIFISIRNSDTSLLSKAPLVAKVGFLDRCLMKFFSISGSGYRLKHSLNKLNCSYALYTSWMYPEAEVLASSNLCIGTVYIEEGQQSYYSANTYPVHGFQWSSRKNKILAGTVDYYFRDDFRACVCLNEDAFPLLCAEKKIILENFEDLKKHYSPFLQGIRCIGITPAPRRIPENKLKHLAAKFVHEMPEGGVVKLHPGFSVHTQSRDVLLGELERQSNGKLKCVSDKTIVELEMLFEQKLFIGPRSSVSRYASLLGSEYRFVDFEGYIPPTI